MYWGVVRPYGRLGKNICRRTYFTKDFPITIQANEISCYCYSDPDDHISIHFAHGTTAIFPNAKNHCVMYDA